MIKPLKSPFPGSHVDRSVDAFASDALFTSVPVRADTRATTCPACLPLIDDHTASWGLTCRLAVKVPTSWFSCWGVTCCSGPRFVPTTPTLWRALTFTSAEVTADAPTCTVPLTVVTWVLAARLPPPACAP